MFPILTFAAALAFGTPHRAADLRSGATTMFESVLAIDGERAITFRLTDNTLRAVPLVDPSAATTLATGVIRAVVAPPLVAWTIDINTDTFIAPIAAPDRALLFSNTYVWGMKCNATACLAEVEDWPEQQNFRGMLFGLDGHVIGRASTGPGLVIAADPDGFLVLTSAVAVERVDNAGHVTFSAPIADASTMLREVVADFDGSRYTVVWPDTGGGLRLRAASIGLTGDVRPAVTIAAAGGATLFGVATSFSAGQHLVAFGYTDFVPKDPNSVPPARLLAVRLDASLHPLDAMPFVVNDTGWAAGLPVIVPFHDAFRVAWSHASGDYGPLDPEMTEVDAAGHVGSRALLSIAPVPQQTSSAAATSGGSIVAWLELDNQERAPLLRVRRFGHDATPAGDVVNVGPDAWSSAIAALGNDALLVWESRTSRFATSRVQAAIVRDDGTLQVIALPELAGRPAVAANRNGWMIVAGEPDAVVSVRVDPTGIASGRQTLVSAVAIDPNVSIASDGDRFVAAWSSPAAQGTRAALLDATGGVLADIILSSEPTDPLSTFAGGEYFLVTGATSAVRLDRNGARIADVSLSLSPAQIAPFGDEVLAGTLLTDGVHVVPVERGIAGNTIVVGAYPTNFALASNGIAYDAEVDGTPAVVFRPILTPRRRTGPRQIARPMLKYLVAQASVGNSRPPLTKRSADALRHNQRWRSDVRIRVRCFRFSPSPPQSHSGHRIAWPR